MFPKKLKIKIENIKNIKKLKILKKQNKEMIIYDYNNVCNY